MQTIYSENVIFSISALALKNEEYKKKITEILNKTSSKMMNYEVHLIEIAYGEKIIKASVVTPDISKIALNNVKDLVHRIKENDAMIRKLAASQPPYEGSAEEAAAIRELIGYPIAQ